MITPLKWVEEIRRTQPAYKGWNGRWPSTTTQFVVGAADEFDLELLQTTAWLNRHVGLKRAYFSAFSPISDTPMENKAPTDPLREHRLYQSSFLLRDYGFDLEDLPFGADGHLPLHTDPKLAWAQANLTERPIEINRAASRESASHSGHRAPGCQGSLGRAPQNSIRDLADLKRLGIHADRAAAFILLDGKQPARQLSMFT